MQSALGRKQRESNAHFVELWQNIEQVITQEHATRLVEDTARQAEQTIGTSKVAYCWSGGKDSQALRVVMAKIGLEVCLLAATRDLEYPAFMVWVQEQKPNGLEIIFTPQDLPFLALHQDWLFPQTAAVAMKWFRVIQHQAQREFARKYKLDMLILGRRRQDGNYVDNGDGTGIYSDRNGVTRYSPLRDWTHEEVLGVCHYFNASMPPIYSWPNGFIAGTGAWPARQWTGSIENGWQEVWQVDPEIVRRAAPYVLSGQQFLERMT